MPLTIIYRSIKEAAATVERPFSPLWLTIFQSEEEIQCMYFNPMTSKFSDLKLKFTKFSISQS